MIMKCVVPDAPFSIKPVSLTYKGGTQVRMARNTLRGDYSEIIGDSPQMFEVLQQIEHFAATSMRVLISGETGTGKGVAARALHKNSGRSGEMVSVNCSAIPEMLLESELFGHEKGAFTGANTRHIGKFERAHHGTLFLDEISEMPLSLQPKLLHAIEEDKIERVGSEKSIPMDVRIVTATNRDIVQAVRDGLFREDLYYRLRVASISLPSLVERQEDIETLVRHFVKKHRGSYVSEVPQIAPSTWILLKSYPWPGNVQELENAIERASYLASGQTFLLEHLPEELWTYQNGLVNIRERPSIPENGQNLNVPLGTTLAAMEETFVHKTLASLDEDRIETAKVLGISLRTLQRKLKKYDI